MAFMMPVVRNDFDIYNHSRKPSPVGSSSGSPSGSMHFSSSPGVHDPEDVRRMYRTSEHLDALEPRQHRSGSFGSLKKFHHLLVDKLKHERHHSNHEGMPSSSPVKKEAADHEPR